MWVLVHLPVHPPGPCEFVPGWAHRGLSEHWAPLPPALSCFVPIHFELTWLLQPSHSVPPPEKTHESAILIKTLVDEPNTLILHDKYDKKKQNKTHKLAICFFLENNTVEHCSHIISGLTNLLSQISFNFEYFDQYCFTHSIWSTSWEKAWAALVPRLGTSCWHKADGKSLL